MSKKATVFLKGFNTVSKEATVTDAAVTPGALLVRTATGVRPHNVAGGAANAMIARENEIFGQGVEVDYAVGDNCMFQVHPRGNEVNCYVAAGAAAITASAAVESAGDGSLRVQSAGAIVGYALEALDNSGGAEIARLIVELA